jgi:hypothetical protein
MPQIDRGEYQKFPLLINPFRLQARKINTR